MEFALVLEGLSGNEYIAGLSPDVVYLAAQRAINKVSARTRTNADREIREQIAFPASYLGPSSKRLWVQKKASKNSLESIVRGRGEPTSLARFAGGAKPTKGNQRPKNNEIGVTVKQGGTRKFIKRAFIIELNNANLGLAVRTNGGPPVGAYKPKNIAKNLWLLYGPSVDQALISAKQTGIYEELSIEVLNSLDAEFFRLIQLEQAK